MENNGIDYEAIEEALKSGDAREKLIFANEEICNEVIVRYLEELSSAPKVPIVRGYSALSPLSKPRTLSDAKRIVDDRI